MQYNRIFTLIMIIVVCLIQTTPIGVSSLDIVIQGYVYVNDELTIPEEVHLNIQNQMISAEISPDDGQYYTSIPTIATGTIVTFLVKISGKSYTPPETLIIEDVIDYYGLDLHIYITENTTLDHSVHYIGTIGYLVDNQNDGAYDTFCSNTTGNITLVQQNNNIYLIDTDGDGNFDHKYNIFTRELNIYSAEQDTNNPLPLNMFILLAALAVLIIVTIALLLSIKRKKQLPQKTILEEKVDHRDDQRKIDELKITDVLVKEIQKKVDEPKLADVQVRAVEQKVDVPKVIDGQVKEVEQKVDVPKITDEQSKETEQKVDVQKVADDQVKEIQQKVDEPKLADSQVKEVEKKIDELTINPKQKKKNNQ